MGQKCLGMSEMFSYLSTLSVMKTGVSDLKRDNIELSSVGDQGRTYPKDLTTLYYWRDTYWRLQPPPLKQDEQL